MISPRILLASLVLFAGAVTLSNCDKEEPASQALPTTEPVAAPPAEGGGTDDKTAGTAAEPTKAAEAKAVASDDPAGAAVKAKPEPAKASEPKKVAGQPGATDTPGAATPPSPGTAAAIVGPPAAAGTKAISAVDGDSYEATLVRAIIAAMTPDEEKGWALYQKELHSDELFARRLQAIRRFNWPYFRRKVPLYLVDDKKPEIRIVRVEQLPKDQVKVFVFNEKSMPTPCHLKKDDKAKGAYRITNCSL